MPKSYGDWIYERHKLGLPLDAPPPAGYESYETWFKRIRGIDPHTGKPISAVEKPGPHLTSAAPTRAADSPPRGSFAALRRVFGLT